MIRGLTGEIKAKTLNSVVLGVQGIDFQLALPVGAAEKLPSIGETVSLFTFLNLREGGIDFYGFSDEKELNFFELLISVNGVGPKSALGILGVASTDKLAAAIAAQDVSLLQQSSGIGRKTAERIILELKEKVGEVDQSGEVKEMMAADGDVIDALVSLGYLKREAKAAVQRLNPQVTGASNRLREALRDLSAKRRRD